MKNGECPGAQAKEAQIAQKGEISESPISAAFAARAIASPIARQLRLQPPWRARFLDALA